MQIAVVHYNFFIRTIKFIKISYLKFFEINLDTYLKIKVFIIYIYI